MANDKLRRIFRSGWRGTCPECGKGPMFAGWLKLVERCPVCGLDYRFAHADDGPAFFALCITAFPLTFVAVWVQVQFDPPWWVHALVSLPIVAVGCLGSLRPFKGWLVASQYLNRAVEAGTETAWHRLDARDDGDQDAR
ncbi:hypothetical protein Y88_2250 [Novosphingobium nitrogenifigens DSM 19370]|uniref:Zinc-finger protein n=1 Tax=Novosphingobium nitrogenifigens DSM 19370 TaxID=983920 RepID=F1Z629_9SPHN|nr:DUF983 domain-containing protein [Novosphingobium nitrogenifigens]EGD59811.1 hypothetical protein Y88_2250 [Novosphingobium nitrogenifigens DSM 19370]